ncbi:MAG: class I SAM-dependent methyltransferase [Actinomycetia bacterium]|nr:class I SAM-dependent methyltransferase [Actinomycetes bacterium]
MNIRNLRRNWDKFAQTDPLWAILSDPEKKKGGWQPDEFFKTGEINIRDLMIDVESLGIDIQKRKALDFGCGIGRLTQPLARYFDEVYGVDISRSMVELARENNGYPDRCQYFVNETDDLKIFPDNSFDLVLSLITLQHMQPRYCKNYFKEFLRVLVPQGLLVFQLPGRHRVPVDRAKGKVPSHLRRSLVRVRAFLLRKPLREMYGMEKIKVIDLLERGGAEIVDVRKDRWTDESWESFTYFVVNS